MSQHIEVSATCKRASTTHRLPSCTTEDENQKRRKVSHEVQKQQQEHHEVEKKDSSLDELAQMSCSGYVFYTSDNSHFDRTDVEPVTMDLSISGSQTRLQATTSVEKAVEPKTSSDKKTCVRQKFFVECGDDLFDFHMCEEDLAAATAATAAAAESTTNPPPFRISNKCNAWCRLSPAQQDVLTKIQERVDADRAEKRYFTCAIIEGPGGCGKTRLMSHLMNHPQTNTMVLYVTKQNRRVQDFIHDDCLKGESDKSVRKPVDLTPMAFHEIVRIVQEKTTVGRYAVTAEKLLFAIANLRPALFNPSATPASLDIDYDVFQRQQDDETTATTHFTHVRNVVMLLDEYTMHQSPLIHALAYHVINKTAAPLVVVMAGDKLQCGPVGWNDTGLTNAADDRRLFTGDVRRDFVVKMGYEPLDVTMETLQRCLGDAALGDCVKRLRRICEDATDTDPYKRKLVNLILARYCVEAGVNLYLQQQHLDGVSVIRKVVPQDLEPLDFDGTGFRAKTTTTTTTMAPGNAADFFETRYTPASRLDDEEYDENGVALQLCDDPPILPRIDMLPLVEHFVKLYTTLAELSYGEPGTDQQQQQQCTDRWTDTVYESVTAIRDLFPVFIVLTNNSCNAFAETFLLALYTQVRKRLLRAPVPDGTVRSSVTPADRKHHQTAWIKHLKTTLRRNVRRLVIDVDEVIQRQTLFVGMVYKMTSTFKTDSSCYLCNGETVVLTSIVYSDSPTSSSLDLMRAVRIRKLHRDADTDFTLLTGRNKNRMTKDQNLNVMPFVPYISENIYQMQGNTVPTRARTFVDLVKVPCRSAYVAVSRFQNSESIKGIVISE